MHDLDLLRDDPCLAEGLGSSIPGTSKVLEFLRALGAHRGFKTVPAHPWNKILTEVVKNIRGKCERLSGRLERATIDVEAIQDPVTSRLAWRSDLQSRLPARIVCIWREADLVLSGGLCHEDVDVMHCLQAALELADAFKIQRLFRMGPVCSAIDVHTWIHEQVYQYESGIPGVGKRAYETHVPFILGLASGSTEIEVLRRKKSYKWQPVAKNDGAEIVWTSSDMEDDPGGPSSLALRRSIGGHHHEYAVIQTNLDTVDGHLFARFTEGQEKTIRAVNEVQRLALGAFPHESAGLAGEGRFRVALLTYNVCSAIRQLAFKGARQRMGLDRFRAHLVQGVGRMMTEEKGRWLKLSQSHVSESFQRIWREFPP